MRTYCVLDFIFCLFMYILLYHLITLIIQINGVSIKNKFIYIYITNYCITDLNVTFELVLFYSQERLQQQKMGFV